ncbi:MAG: hypothetical protein SWE60_10550 [Thermodesulfobacteriota bacterium]|nr:hypothetical protein [Thermodesulfobacteriota bacterium]
MRQIPYLAEQFQKTTAARKCFPGEPHKGYAVGLALGTALDHGRRAVKQGLAKALLFPIVLSLGCFAGCAKHKGYFYHPSKTTAERQADYSQCMYTLDASFSRYGTVSSPGAETWGSDSQAQISKAVEECMKSKGYKIVSEKKAKALGVNTQDPWPPHAKTSSSTGP